VRNRIRNKKKKRIAQVCIGTTWPTSKKGRKAFTGWGRGENNSGVGKRKRHYFLQGTYSRGISLKLHHMREEKMCPNEASREKRDRLTANRKGGLPSESKKVYNHKKEGGERYLTKKVASIARALPQPHAAN